MIPDLEYVRPKNLPEVLALLHENQNAKIIAGGTDIMPGFRQGASRFKNIKLLIDINAIPELKLVEIENNSLFIGAAATFSTLIHHSLIAKQAPILYKASLELGSVQIRNRATLAGNFINNAPCADSVPALLVYDAVLTIQSFHHKRKISLKDFLVKPYQTQLKPTEIVTKIKLPLLHDDYIGDFYKLGRRRGVAISRITMALLMKINEDVISDIRFASGAVSPIGLRFEELEAAVRGNKITENLYKDMARQVGRKILDITKLRWSSAYKVPVLQQMVYQLFQRIYPTK